MNTTQLTVGVTVIGKDNIDDGVMKITKGKLYEIVERAKYGIYFYDDNGHKIGQSIVDGFDEVFTTTPPDQEGKREEIDPTFRSMIESIIVPQGYRTVHIGNPLIVSASQFLYKSSVEKLISEVDSVFSQLQSRVKELEGLNEAAEKHIEIITRERDWQTDVVVPDLDQQIAALRQENERLKGGIYPAVAYGIGVGQCYPASEQFSKEDLNDYGKKFIEKIIPTLPPTATTTDEQTDK